MGRQLIRDMGTCLSFNGTTAVVSTALWSATPTVMLSAWFKSSNFQRTEQCIIINGDGVGGTGRGQGVILSGNTTTDGSLMMISENLEWVNLNCKVQDNYWHFIAVVMSGAKTYTTYLDGVSQGAVTGGVNFGIPNTASYVGGDGASGGRAFLGKIDDARCYTTPPTAAEIVNMYYGIEPTSTTPTNKYLFNEGSGSTANDTGSAPKNGTISNATYSSDVAFKPRTAL